MPPAAPWPPFGLGVAGALLAGLLCAFSLPALPPAGVGLGLALAGLLAWHRGARVLRFAGAALLGLGWCLALGAWAMAARWPEARSGETIALEGRVAGLPRRDARALQFEFDVEHAAAPALHGRRVRLSWHGPAPDLVPGGRWRLQARLKRPRGLANPGGEGTERRLLAAGIVATCSVVARPRPEALAPPSGIAAWRERRARRIAGALPEPRDRFVRAFAVGDARALGDADWSRLRAAGLTHLVAISGFHVGLVAGFGALLLRLAYRIAPRLGRRWPRPCAAACAALLAGAAYTLAAGAALPTLRTLLMLAAVALARAGRRPASAGAAFALAAIVLALADPLGALAPGFWLSFLGVGWLLWCLPAPTVAAPWRGLARAQLVATVGLLPLTAFLFGQVSFAGPLANLVSVPLVSLVIVPLCLLGLLLDPLWAGGAAGAWTAAAWLVEAGWRGLGVLDAWPLAEVWLPEAGAGALGLALLGAAWLLLPRGAPGKPLALLLWLPLLWPASGAPPEGAVDVEVLDAGQGLAVLVRSRGHALLYDAGPAPAGGGEGGLALQALRARGVHRLDLLVLSHRDPAHAGGAGALRRAQPGLRVLGPEGWATPGMGLCRAGQHWRWDGVAFEVLHPPPHFPYLGDDSSCVLRVSAGGRAALLAGDLGAHAQAGLLRRARGRLRADLLVAPARGAARAWNGDFTAAVAPRVVVFSSGWRNRAGSPTPDMLARYAAAGARPLHTGTSGALRFRLQRGGLSPASARREAPRRWWRDRAGGSGYAIGQQGSDR